MTEWLTIFDSERNTLGKKLRDEAHRDGDWHETFHCWFVEKDDEDMFLYFQLRSKNKKKPHVYGILLQLDILCMMKMYKLVAFVKLRKN